METQSESADRYRCPDPECVGEMVRNGRTPGGVQRLKCRICFTVRSITTLKGQSANEARSLSAQHRQRTDEQTRRGIRQAGKRGKWTVTVVKNQIRYTVAGLAGEIDAKKAYNDLVLRLFGLDAWVHPL